MKYLGMLQMEVCIYLSYLLALMIVFHQIRALFQVSVAEASFVLEPGLTQEIQKLTVIRYEEGMCNG